MTFTESVRSALTKYATFSGRACRSEYWWYVLFVFLVDAVSILLDQILGTAGEFDGSLFGERGIVELLASIALFLPGLGVLIRRLHDAGWSGWWLLTFVPPFLFFVFMKGDDGPNEYGRNPLAEDLGA